MKRGLLAKLLGIILLFWTSPLLADVDVSITDAYLVDRDTGLPMETLVMSQLDSVMLMYEVVCNTTVYDGEESVTKKIEINRELKPGSLMKSDLGLLMEPGEVEKQDGTIVNAHHPDIIDGELPALANSVGTRVAAANNCPDPPSDQVGLPHPYTAQRVVGANKFCKHFVGHETTLQVLVGNTGLVQEPGFPDPDNVRTYTFDGPVIWDKIEKKVNEPGTAYDVIDDDGWFSVPDVAPGTYPIDVAVDIEVEDAIDIDPSNNVYTFTFYLVVEAEEIPTLHEWGMIILALLLLAIGTVAVVRRRKAFLSRSV